MRAPEPSHNRSLPAATADILARLRGISPRVHCITNSVAQAFTANVLLAAGAIPSMTISLQEISAFAARADALLVNLGTFDTGRADAIDLALREAANAGRPWVLDPVLIDVSPQRAAYARALVARRPAAIRLNAAEFSALSEGRADGETLSGYAREHGIAIGMTGDADIVGDGNVQMQLRNGHALMSRVTAMGCAASALVAACLAVERNPVVATASALLAFGIAGEVAAENARGPGSFAAGFLDAIFNLGESDIMQRAKIT